MVAVAEPLTHTKKVTNSPLILELTTPIDDRRPVYIVGNFNNWNAEDTRFKFKRTAFGKFSFCFPNNIDLPRRIEYKYVRGGWENQELDEFGNRSHNRVLDNPKGTIYDVVSRWSNYGLDFNPAFLPKIQVISEQFEIPQLNRKRKVSILLPHNYYNQPHKQYPVLYLQDGQNLFNPNAPYGNWGIDKKLAVLAEKGYGDMIVVAIDHAGKERINEFLPIKNKQLGISEGKKYIRFIVETLKPYIDNNFRTMHERQHTAIGGSSLGGLISIYAGLRHPTVFGRLMIFSPSLWVTQNVPFDLIHFFQPIPTKIYVYAGGNEGGNMVTNIKNFKESLYNQGFASNNIHFKLSIDPQGTHNEYRWGQEFPKAVDWLFHC
jgi:predicted alpha/beta superfamily hydrolase